MAETKLLSYADLAEALGITPASAKRLAQRRRWPKQPGNDGRARVIVPVERLERRQVVAGDVTDDDAGDAAGDDADDDLGVTAIVVGALSRHVERLEKEIEALKGERDAALSHAADRDRLAVQLDALNAVLTVERERFADVKSERDRLRNEAEGVAERESALRAELGLAHEASTRDRARADAAVSELSAWKTRPWWRRLRVS